MLQAPLLDGKATGAPASAMTTPAMTGRRGALRLAKRSLDVAAALATLFLLAPLMGLVALLVALDGGPVLYRHLRVGLGGRTFECLKFRTMIDDAEASFSEYLSYNPAAGSEWDAGRKLRFDPRVTAIGRALRSSSLDELPQLLNVLRGDMSLVGPRPIAAPEVELYGTAAPLYFSVRPGLTGSWQISGRNEADFAARVRHDERYVREWSMAKDLAILARTPGEVLRRRGAS